MDEVAAFLGEIIPEPNPDTAEPLAATHEQLGDVQSALSWCTRAAAAVGPARARSGLFPELARADTFARLAASVVLHGLPAAAQHRAPDDHAREAHSRLLALSDQRACPDIFAEIERASGFALPGASDPTGYADARSLAEELGAVLDVPVTPKEVYQFLRRKAERIELGFGSKSWRSQNKKSEESEGRRTERKRSEPEWVFRRDVVWPHLLKFLALKPFE